MKVQKMDKQKLLVSEHIQKLLLNASFLDTKNLAFRHDLSSEVISYNLNLIYNYNSNLNHRNWVRLKKYYCLTNN